MTNYNRRIPYELLGPNCVVFLVDFSFPLEDMKKIASEHKLVWCDHHDPVNSYINEGFDTIGNCRIEPGVSGTTLIWELLFPDKELPKACQLVANYDTWQLSDPDVLNFNIGTNMISMDTDKASEETWRKLFTDNNFVQRIVDVGEIINEFGHMKSQLMCERNSFPTEIDGVPALAINVKNTNSKVLDYADPDNKYVYRILFSWFGNINQYRVSVFTEEDGKYDVAEYCRKFGGNGRASCGGFVTSHLPFKLPTQTEKPDTKTIYDNEMFRNIKKLINSDPLIGKYYHNELNAIVNSLHTPGEYLNWKAAFINNPYVTEEAFYETGINFYCDIGIVWTLGNDGWYELRIYPLNLNIKVNDIADKVVSDYKTITDTCVIVKQSESPMLKLKLGY